MKNEALPWGINRIGSPYHPDVHCQMPNGQWAHAVCEPHDMGRLRAAWWVLTGRAYAFLWPRAGELEGIWLRLNPPEIRPSPRPFVPQADSQTAVGHDKPPRCPATRQVFEIVLAALNYDGADINSLTVGEIRRALP